MFLTLQILAGHDGQAKTSGAISAIPLNLKVTAASLPLARYVSSGLGRSEVLVE